MVKSLPKFSIVQIQMLSVSLRICLVMLSVVLALVDIQVKAAPSRGNPNLITPADEESLELYFPYGSYIHISPSAPTPNDVIRITVSGESACANVPRYLSHEIVGNMIKIYTTPPFPICLPAITPWSFTVEVGPLPVGAYNVQANGQLCSFLVATERAYIYLPVILRRSVVIQ